VSCSSSSADGGQTAAAASVDHICQVRVHVGRAASAGVDVEGCGFASITYDDSGEINTLCCMQQACLMTAVIAVVLVKK